MIRQEFNDELYKRAEQIVLDVIDKFYKLETNFVDSCLAEVRESDHWFMKPIFEDKEYWTKFIKSKLNGQT